MGPSFEQRGAGGLRGGFEAHGFISESFAVSFCCTRSSVLVYSCGRSFSESWQLSETLQQTIRFEYIIVFHVLAKHIAECMKTDHSVLSNSTNTAASHISGWVFHTREVSRSVENSAFLP